MLLVAHIFFAIAGIALMAVALVGKIQSRNNNHNSLVRLSFWSFMGLIVTGTGLVVKYHQAVKDACVSGLLYFGVLGILYFAYRKLAASNL